MDALKELLGEELYNQVTAKLGDKKIDIISDGNWFPKSKFDEKLDEIKTLKGQIVDRDKQLEDLKKNAGDNQALKDQIAKLQQDNETATKTLQEKLDAQAFDFALERALGAAKAKNPRAVKALLDAGKLKLDGEKLLGLDDQLKTLKESDAYLFDETNGGSGGANPPGGGGFGGRKNPWTKEHFNLTEQGKIMQENPALAAQMKAAVGK